MQENTSKTKHNLDTLKKNLNDLEKLIESKNDVVAKNLKKIKMHLMTLSKLIETSSLDIFARIQPTLE